MQEHEEKPPEALDETAPRVLVQRADLLALCRSVVTRDDLDASLRAHAFLSQFGDGKNQDAKRERECTGFYSEQGRG